MKRFVRAGTVSAILYAAVAAAGTSCSWMPEIQPDKDAGLSFRFNTTKGEPFPDTNGFILRVKAAGAESFEYDGPYGKRPSSLKVAAGSYEAAVYSCDFRVPAFDSPLYKDEQMIVARSGENLTVSFMCKAANSGVKLLFSERFKNRYPGKMLLKQNEGQLEYPYSEKRTAWLFPGQVDFCYSDGNAVNILFRRTLQAGDLTELTIDATENESQSAFRIAVDTSLVRRRESVVVGNETGGDGLSPATAYCASQLASAGCAGDTVWVWGYIIGGLTETGEVDFECESGISPNALVIADELLCRDPASCAALNLTKTAHKAALSPDIPENRAAIFHKRIYAKGKVTTYKKLPALTNLCDYLIE